jgi:hypothetical protein
LGSEDVGQGEPGSEGGFAALQFGPDVIGFHLGDGIVRRDFPFTGIMSIVGPTIFEL